MSAPASAGGGSTGEPAAMPSSKPRAIVLVHGGAWTMPPYLEQDYIAGVEAAAMAGYRALTGAKKTKGLSDRIAATGGASVNASDALDAVESAVRSMEDTPIFNAGTGSSLTVEGKVEMDAIIMDGRNLGMGAVSSLTVAKNAVSVARLVMEHSRHGFLTGAGADGFATHMGANLASQKDLLTEQAMIKLIAARNHLGYSKMLEVAAAAGAPAQSPPTVASADASAAGGAPAAAAEPENEEALPHVRDTLVTDSSVGAVMTQGKRVISVPTVERVLATSVIEPIAKRIRAHKRTTRAKAAAKKAAKAKSPRAKSPRGAATKRRAASPAATGRATKAARAATTKGKGKAAAARPKSAGARATRGKKKTTAAGPNALPDPNLPMDTVGAVALDFDGHVAAATSTGGTTNKAPGRVGDAPLTGSGGYADDMCGAVSTTGQGEAIMRVCLALNALNRVNETTPPRVASQQALSYMKRRVGGVGGLIMVTKDGQWAASCTTKRMAWACVDNGTMYSGVTNGGSTPFSAADLAGLSGGEGAASEADNVLGPAGQDLVAHEPSLRVSVVDTAGRVVGDPDHKGADDEDLLS